MTRSSLGSKERTTDGRWRVRVEHGVTEDGRRRVMRETVDTEREADEAIARLSHQMRVRPHAGDPMTLADFYHRFFLPERRAYLSAATLNQYEGYWRRYVGPRLGDVALSELRFTDVQASMRGMTRSCAQHYAATVRAIVGAAWEGDFVDSNPLQGRRLRFPGAAPAPLPVWGAREVAVALTALRCSPLYRLWLVMVGSGAGREEAYALFERDLRYETVLRMTPEGPREEVVVRATIDDAVTVEDGRRAPKNARRYRVVEIAEPFSSALLETRPEDPDAPICRVALSGLPRAWKALWKPSGFSEKADARFYRGRMIGTGVPFVTLSRMRATHETLMQQGNVTDTLNAAIHGRTNVQTGYRHYLAPRDEARMEAARAVGDQVARELSN